MVLTPAELRLAADHLDNEAPLFVRQGQAALRACGFVATAASR